MINARRYQDLPFADRGRGDTVDCWGLVQRVYRDEFGIELPGYDDSYLTTTDREEISAMIRQEQHHWAAVPLQAAHTGDVVLMRIEGRLTHVGIVLDAPHFLHALKGAGVVVESWESLIWRRRVVGAYRLKERAGAGSNAA